MADSSQTQNQTQATEQNVAQDAATSSNKIEFGIRFPGQEMHYLDLDSGEAVSLSGGEDILIFGANQAASELKEVGEHLDILFDDGRTIRLLSFETANETCPVTIDLIESARAQFLAQQAPEELFIGQDNFQTQALNEYSQQRLPDLAFLDEFIEVSRREEGNGFIRPEAEPFLEREEILLRPPIDPPDDPPDDPPEFFNAPQFFQANGSAPSDYSGRALGAGDFNGDGFDDFLIGAEFANSGEVSFYGEAAIFFGREAPVQSPIELADLEEANGGDGTEGFVVNSTDEEVAGEIGSGVSSAGDFNGDGIEDVLVGIPLLGEYDTGGAAIVFGSPNFDAEVDLADISSGDGSTGTLITGLYDYDLAGSSVDGGDFDGDGLSDIVLGTPFAFYDGALVIHGTQTPTANFDTNLLSFFNGNDGSLGSIVRGFGDEQAGTSVSFGDINGDGYDDLLIGAPQGSPAAGSAAGKSYLLLGGIGGLGAEYDLSFVAAPFGSVINGAQAQESAGFDVAVAGDINGDGFDDLIIGAPFADVAGEENVGRVFVVFGREEGLPSEFNLSSLIGGDGSEGFVINGMQPGGLFGFSVTGLGDLNGDGFDDFSIGAPFANGGVGSALTIFGGPANTFSAVNELSAFDATNSIIQDGLAANNNFGYDVASGGDFNGDGFTEDVTSAPGSLSYAGQTSVLTGFNNGQVDVVGSPGQDDLLGTSDADNIVAGQDDDILRGEGGADNLYGAEGDDQMIVPDFTFARAYGGSGTDTLEVTGTGLFGDFTTAGGLIKRVRAENIDLGNTNNTIVLSAIAVINLSRDDINTNAESIPGLDGVNTLMVFGSDTDTVELTDQWTIVDTVVFEGENFTRLAPEGGQLATLLVQEEIALELPEIPEDTDDTFLITEQNFAPVDGGGGEDTLVLDSSLIFLDFTSLPQNIAQNIERIDLTAPGSQDLILDLQDIIDLTDDNNVLEILGTDEDIVEIQLIGEGFVESIDGDFTVYSNGAVTIRIDSDIDQSNVLLDLVFV